MMPGLYASILGEQRAALGDSVWRLHHDSPGARGYFLVKRGQGWLARLLGAVMRMPPAAERAAVELRVERAGLAERWVRAFDGKPLCTEQWAEGGLLVEGMGPIQCWFRLRAEGGTLRFEQARATFGLRGFCLPLPRFLWPTIAGSATPSASPGGVRVDVRIGAPVAGLLVSYEGEVSLDGGAS